jgi:hypothetical protein
MPGISTWIEFCAVALAAASLPMVDWFGPDGPADRSGAGVVVVAELVAIDTFLSGRLPSRRSLAPRRDLLLTSTG